MPPSEGPTAAATHPMPRLSSRAWAATAMSDVLPPPVYVIEPYLEAYLAVRDPAAAIELVWWKQPALMAVAVEPPWHLSTTPLTRTPVVTRTVPVGHRTMSMNVIACSCPVGTEAWRYVALAGSTAALLIFGLVAFARRDVRSA